MRWSVLLLVAACGGRAPRDVAVEAEVTTATRQDATRGVTDPRLAALLAEHWEATMERSPEWATQLGDHRYDDRLGDRSAASIAAWRQRQRAWLEVVKGLPTAELGAEDQLTVALFAWDLEEDLGKEVCRFEAWSVLPRSNAFTDIHGLAEDFQLRTPRDGENLVARYRAAPEVLDAEVANLRVGLAAGLVANARSVELVVEMIDAALAEDEATWPLLEPFAAEHGWDREVAAALRVQAERAVTESIRPAYVRYRDFLRDEVRPVARPQDATGLAALPNGPACYAALARGYTTLDRTPEQIHQQGLDALAGIHAEFQVLGERLWGTSDLAVILPRLRSEPALRFGTGDEVQAAAREALDAANAAIPQWFGVLPRAACEVKAIPAHEAPYTTVAYYQGPTPGERPGTYYVNTWAPETRLRHEARVLAFHESVPGHHLQIAIAQERGELPAFRRHGGATAFVEGWALYTERLVDEMGLYRDDLDRMGMLSFDAWRAGRLVVDTGIHHLGWSRERAEAFLLENTPLAENNVRNEVDRYVTWPGQALAYKTGQMEIRALRAEAEAALGDRFDVRGFHDVVLSGGAVPLPVLRQRVNEWVGAVRAR